MLKSITITNYLGNSATYRIQGADPDDGSGLLITEITGLGPTKADINMTELATADGGIFNSARASSRNIVIKAKFTNAKTIEEARLASYKFFPIKKKVIFHIETDNRIAETEGYVESNDPVIFSDSCEMQVSILCESPYFLSVSEEGKKETTFAGIDFLFEFPFENDSLQEPLLEFGNIVNKKENTVYYDGDAETGCIINIHAVGQANKITIYNIKTREIMNLDTDKLQSLGLGTAFEYGDDITINTIKGQKSITLLRNGVTYNILNILGKDADWFQLAKGDNLFTFVAEYGETNLQFKIYSQVVYEGV